MKAPKNQKNTFANYNYRSCEDILEAVKPLLEETASVLLSDEIVLIGDRYYVKATATFKDSAGKETSVTAYAREALEKKGNDAAQITGAASSYARKYALNGLFLIDDTKDADSEDNTKTEKPLTNDQKKAIADRLATLGVKPEEIKVRAPLIVKEKTTLDLKESNYKTIIAKLDEQIAESVIDQ